MTTTDALSRRLRFAPPNPTRRAIPIGEGDMVVFGAIARHGPLPSHYLFEFKRHLVRDWKRFQVRLADLYHGDEGGPYLIRPPRQFDSFQARYQHVVYDLAPRTRALLGITGRRRPDPFLHQLMNASIAASIEIGAPRHGLSYVARADILSHPKLGAARDAANPMALPVPGADRSLIPDDLFGLRYPDATVRFFAVEADRNTESIERSNLDKTTFGRKLTDYLAIIRSGYFRTWWGIPNLHVLTVTTNQTHAKHLIAYLEKLMPGDLASRFGFSVVPEFGPAWRVPKTLLTHLLDEPWSSVASPKSINTR